MIAGGELDIGVIHLIAIRAIEADHLLFRGVGENVNGFQTNAGVIFRFDGR